MDFKVGQKVIHDNKLMVVVSLVSFEEATNDGLLPLPHGYHLEDFPLYDITDGNTNIFAKKKEIKLYDELSNIEDVEIKLPNKIADSQYKVGGELVVVDKHSLLSEKSFGDIVKIVDVRDEGTLLLDIYVEIDNKIHILSEDEIWGLRTKKHFDSLSDFEKQYLKNDFYADMLKSVELDNEKNIIVESKKMDLDSFINLNTINYKKKIELLTNLLSEKQNCDLALRCLVSVLDSINLNNMQINETRIYLMDYLKNSLNDKNELLKIKNALKMSKEDLNSKYPELEDIGKYTEEEFDLMIALECTISCIEVFLTCDIYECVDYCTASVEDSEQQEKFILNEIVKLLKGDI